MTYYNMICLKSRSLMLFLAAQREKILDKQLHSLIEQLASKQVNDLLVSYSLYIWHSVMQLLICGS